jgi:hypothetical protein
MLQHVYDIRLVVMVLLETMILLELVPNPRFRLVAELAAVRADVAIELQILLCKTPLKEYPWHLSSCCNVLHT